MPLQVEIKINGNLIETIHIGRIDKFRGENRVHAYRVWDEYGASAEFAHNYSKGARECVRKGLNALEGKRQ